ncbi:unnamed protein product [Adineta steineri]|uniref:Catalase core domain-containing protein n=1 Tax=Adineta steineri TaxID=433720 RepID=A0A818YLA1_9BILA|nr:unnamed protein product [Adineta steineri]
MNTHNIPVQVSNPPNDQVRVFKVMTESELAATNGVRHNGDRRGSQPVVDRRGSLPVSDRRGSLPVIQFPFAADVQRSKPARIPGRIVHTRGAGAFGVFEATDDISDVCKATVFNVADGAGPVDTLRESRGFAIKMYTDEGIWDLVGSSLPVFPIKDPALFPPFSQSLNRNPQTRLKDANIFWNFLTSNPQTIHHTILVNSDRDAPESFRFMDCYGAHTFKMINQRNEFVWVKFHLRYDQDIKTFDPEAANIPTVEQFNHAAADLFNAIAIKNFPSWTLYIQIMTEEQARRCPFNPFDLTKIFSQKEYPLHKVGKITLNENPIDYFSQIEQVAFTPAHMPPGIEASPDRIFQMRISFYNEQQPKRLGPNNLLLPINNPATNPIFFGIPHQPNAFMQTPATSSSLVRRNISNVASNILLNVDDFTQARDFYKNVLDSHGRSILTKNIADSLARCTDRNLVGRALFMMSTIDDTFARRIGKKLNF